MVYGLYVGVLVAALLGAPLVIARWSSALAGPPAVDVLRSPGSALVVATACGARARHQRSPPAGVRGPVLLTPVRALLAATDLPRRRTLRGALLAPVALLVAAAAAVAAVLGSALVAAGTAVVVGAVGFVVASAAFAVLSGVLWLTGQVLAGDHPGATALVAGALVAATALTVAVPALGVIVPWGWVGAAWPGAAAPPWWPVAALCLAAAGALSSAPALLGRLHLRVVLDQSRRWQAARTAASVADVATALDTFRTGPRRGRRRRAVVPAPAPVRYLVRDVVGASRTPARALVATVALMAAGAAIGVSAAGPLATVGAVVALAALGVFSGGFRHAAASAGAARLDGHGPARRYALHATLPVLLGVVAVGAGAWTAALTVAPGVPAVTAVVDAVLVTAVLVAVRAYDSARGPLPLILLVPVPSPVGDLSGPGAALWQVDAVLLAALATAVVVTTTATSGPALGATVAATLTTTVLAMTVRRVRRA